eukprot:10319850-Alexandrium_andersonii.AAC.1
MSGRWTRAGIRFAGAATRPPINVGRLAGRGTWGVKCREKAGLVVVCVACGGWGGPWGLWPPT